MKRGSTGLNARDRNIRGQTLIKNTLEILGPRWCRREHVQVRPLAKGVNACVRAARPSQREHFVARLFQDPFEGPCYRTDALGNLAFPLFLPPVKPGTIVLDSQAIGDARCGPRLHESGSAFLISARKWSGSWIGLAI